MPNGMYGGVRGEKKKLPYSIWDWIWAENRICVKKALLKRDDLSDRI